MPGGDRTGPWGQGPMTGRGMGFCGGYGMPGSYATGGLGWWGRGRGRGRGGGFPGRGGGRGWRHTFWATGMPGWARSGPFGAFGVPVPMTGASMSKSEEVEVLKQQADFFRSSLEDIQKRMEALESSDE